MNNWTHWINNIYFGDCKNLMSLLPDKCINLIFTSPPYANLRKYGKNNEGCIHPDKYVPWLMEFIKEFYRILKPDGSFIININDKVVKKERHLYIFDLVPAIVREAGFSFIETYIWHKGDGGFPGVRGFRFPDAFEYVFWFAKDKDKVTFNRADVKVKAKYNDKRTNKVTTKSGYTLNRANFNKKTSYPRNVIYLPAGARLSRKDLLKYHHPAIMPEELAEFFIKLGSNKGDLVFDPFGGSGTTAVMARKLNRNFLISDIVKEICELIRYRLSKEKIQLGLGAF